MTGGHAVGEFVVVVADVIIVFVVVCDTDTHTSTS